MAKKSKSVSKAASVLASDDSSADAKSLAGSVLATSDDEEKTEARAAYQEAAAEMPLDDDAMVRFQDEAPFSVETSDPEPPEIVGEYSPDLADSETLEEFPVMSAEELREEGFGTVVEIAYEPVPDHIAEAIAAAQEAAGHVPVSIPANRA